MPNAINPFLDQEMVLGRGEEMELEVMDIRNDWKRERDEGEVGVTWWSTWWSMWEERDPARVIIRVIYELPESPELPES